MAPHRSFTLVVQLVALGLPRAVRAQELSRAPPVNAERVARIAAAAFQRAFEGHRLVGLQYAVLAGDSIVAPGSFGVAAPDDGRALPLDAPSTMIRE